MKIVRLKKGFKILCSDSDFSVLAQCVGFVLAGDVGETLEADTPAEKAAITRLVQRGVLSIDEDRRST